MALTRKDLASDAWAHIKAHLTAEIEVARDALESFSLPADRTAAVRGDIARMRKLLALEPPGPVKAPGALEEDHQDDDGADD